MIKIIGTGSYLPEKILTNKDIEKIVDTTDEWIIQRTGIKERRIAREDEATSDLAYNASIKALEMAKMSPQDIELIILGTSTPDYQIPACAPIIQNRLGCKRIPAFDVNSVCTSFTFAFLTAYSYIATGLYNNCLLIGVDTYSKILNWKDRNSCVIFGDGGGAFVIKKDTNKKGILSHVFGVEGSGTDQIRIPVGGSRNPLHTIEDFNKYNPKDLYFQMEGKKVYEFTLSVITGITKTLIEKSGLKKEDIDIFVFHQANIRIIDMISRTLNIPIDKFLINIDRVGNTSSASIPIVIDEAVRDGKIKNGDKILMLGFGGGLSWGGVVFEW